MSTAQAGFNFRLFGSLRRSKEKLLAADYIDSAGHSSKLKQALEAIESHNLSSAHKGTKSLQIFSSAVLSAGWLFYSQIILTLVSVLLSLVGIVVGQRIFVSESFNFAILIAFVFLILEVSKAGISYWNSCLRVQAGSVVQLHLLQLVNRKLFNFDRKHAVDISSGNLKTLVSSDIDAVGELVTQLPASVVPSISYFVLFGSFIAYQGGLVGFSALLLVTVPPLISLLLLRFSTRLQIEAQCDKDALSTLVGEWVRNIRLVRFLGWSEAIQNETGRKVAAYIHAGLLRYFIVIIDLGISNAGWFFPVALMVFYANGLAVADLFGIIWALFLLAKQLEVLPLVFYGLGDALASLRRISQFLAVSEVDVPHTINVGGTLPDNFGKLIGMQLSDVVVELGSKKILGPLNIYLDLTSRTAIVGEVGAGKSALIGLLSGELKPSIGSVLCHFSSGVVGDLWQSEFYSVVRSKLALVPQEPYLSNASLRRNIDIWDQASEDLVNDAVEHCQLAPDIDSFANGLDEEVGESGINLSGGQKQRVAIARALVSRRPILILDDPLSAVDRKTEEALAKNLLNGQYGVVLASHRLNELTRCDRLLVLENGVVVEDGHPAALAEQAESKFTALLSAHIPSSSGVCARNCSDD